MFPVEIYRETLAKWITILRDHGIRFHLTGGLTGTAYGEPRMTQDIDIVIDPRQTQDNLDSLIETISKSDFIYNEGAIRQAVAKAGVFQLLDKVECLKLDVYAREMIVGELDRSEQIEIFAGELLPVVSRVDAAASKLVWINKGSHKSRRDLRAITRKFNQAQKDSLRKWAQGARLADLLDEVVNESDELE